MRTTRATGLKAFSLLELIGVLALLAIVAGLLLPRRLNSSQTGVAVHGASNARVQDVIAGVRALKTAAAEHYARFGSMASRNGTRFDVPAAYDGYDAILLSEQLLQRPFATGLGKGVTVRLVNVSALSSASRPDALVGAYDLEGSGRNSIVRARHLVELVVSGVTEPQARAINDALDGARLGGGPGEDDLRGSVTYFGTGPTELRQVHIYITHD